MTERLIAAAAEGFVAAGLAALTREVRPQETVEIFSTLTGARADDAVGIELREVPTAAELWLVHEAHSYGPFQVGPREGEEFSRLVNAVLHGKVVLRLRRRGRRRWLTQVTFDGRTWRLPISMTSLLLAPRPSFVQPPGYGDPGRPL